MNVNNITDKEYVSEENIVQKFANLVWIPNAKPKLTNLYRQNT